MRVKNILEKLNFYGNRDLRRYEYKNRNHFSTFKKQVGALKKRLNDKNKIFIGWPGITYSEEENNHLINQLKNKINVKIFNVNQNKYEDYLKKIDYKGKYPNYYNFNFHEKTLEHYLAYELLNLTEGDRFIDIAAEGSPISKEFSRLTGCVGYKQDIMFAPGIHGKKIGGNASEIPVEDNFFQSALASCSIEHFEKNADIESMKEISRILTKKGRIVVIPLYLHKNPFYVTDPRFSIPGKVEFDTGVDIHCVKEFKNRHGRYYSPETLFERLIGPNLNRMNFTIYYIQNFRDIDPSVYCRFCLMGEKII